jgi:hypothetical protein
MFCRKHAPVIRKRLNQDVDHATQKPEAQKGGSWCI